MIAQVDIVEVGAELKGDIADARVSIARLEAPLPRLQRI